MTSGWTRTRLGEVVKIKHGFAFSGMAENADSSLPVVVGIGNFDYAGGFRFGSTTIKRYVGEYPSEFTLTPGDVLLAMTCQTAGGEILGIPGTVPDDGQTYLHNQRLGKVEVLDPTRIDLRYFFQLARWQPFNHHLFSTASGSKILHTSPGRIEEFSVDLPPLPEQQSIADVLGAIDEKIESNRRKAEISQEVLRALYKSWFVEYAPWGGAAPHDWREGTLRDVVDIVRNPTKAGRHPERPYIPIDTIPMHSLGLDQAKPNTEAKSSLFLFETNDILLGAMRVYFHRVALAPFSGITRNTTFVLRPKVADHLAFSLLTCDDDSTIAYAQATSKGSTMPYAVWDGGLGELPLLIPAHEVLLTFNQRAKPLLNLIRDQLNETRSLIELRDTLLPKLLSGRIRVPADEVTT